MLEQIAHFRQLGTLNDGTRVLLRPLLPEDKDALLAFFTHSSEEDRKHMRTDVTDRALVGSWVDNINYHKVLPLVAVANGHIVGDCTLHFRGGPQRHVADVRIFLEREFRQRGLGTLMLKVLVDLARRIGLQFIEAEVMADQTRVIKAFESVGFEREVTYPDYYLMPDGEAHDVTVLILSLKPKKEDF